MHTDLADVWRRESPHVLAALLTRYADLTLCEDAAQEAAESAAVQWPRDGMPDDPRAWLIRVASRRAVDRIRSEAARRHREQRLALADEPHTDAGALADPETATRHDADDTVQLLLLCCHPSLSRPSQVALTLKAVGGLRTEEIARGFLVPPATMGQRLSRARATLREAGARFSMPAPAELPARIAAVLDVCHLIFTEGAMRTSGAALVDRDLTAEAIRIVRLLTAAVPDHDEAAGLLALMLLTEARAAARTDEHADLVPLAEQDRSRWDAALIAEGVAIVERVLPTGPVGRFQLQAAIAAVHAESPTWEQTDWPQIVALYRMLEAVAPSPAVTLNRAVAVSMVDGPDAGITLLATLLADPRPRLGHRVHAVHAHLLEQAGRTREAAAAYREAARLTASTPEQRYLNRRLAALTS